MIFLFHLSRLIRVLLLILVLFLAVLLTSVRIFLPEISEYRAEIVSSISASIGKPIEMDSMTAGLSGIRPEVVLNGLKIIDPTDHKVLLRFDQLRAGLNVKEFLLTGNFQPRWVTIRGAKLSITRKMDGSISLVGLDSGAEMPKWIFEEGQFELLDSEVDWEDQKHPQAGLRFSSADIRLLNTDRQHKVAIDADLPSGYGKSLSIRMDYQGDIFLRDCCSGQIYFRARDIRYGKLLEGFSVDGYRVMKGRGGFRFWSTWEKSVLVSLGGEVDFREGTLSHVSTGPEDPEALMALHKIAGAFHWMRKEQTWSLSVRRLELNLNGDAWPLTDLGVKHVVDPAAGTSNFYLTSSYVKFDDFKQLLVNLQALAPPDHRVLLATDPSGEIFDLRLGYSSSRGQSPEWFVCGLFENIGLKPTQSYPGATNLSGKVCGDQNHGDLQLAATRTELQLPDIFRNPIDLTTVHGDFEWDRDDLGWKISGERIKIVNPVLAAEAKMVLQLPITEGEPFLDMRTSFENVDAAAAHRYLPVGVLKKPLIEWLDTAFLSGTVTHGAALFRGPIQAFPFRGGEGVFEALFYTKDVNLSYHRAWPVINTDVAEVRFFQAGLDIRGEHASVMGTSVDDIRVHAANFELDDYLIITGRAEGTVQQSINFLKNSPLASLYKPLLEFVSIRGDDRLDLELKVPISSEIDDVMVNGTLSLNKARLNAFGVQLDRINGKLDFSRTRIRGQRIRAELLGSPVQVELLDIDRRLAVQLNGSIRMAALAERHPSKFWEFVNGETGYSIDLEIPKLGRELFADIDVHSDLRGISISLPEPLQKPANLARRFNLKMHVEPGRDILTDLIYGNIGRAHLKLAKTREGFELEQGKIRLGRVSGGKATDKGLNFYARLERFDLAPWKNFLASLNGNTTADTAGLNLVDVQIDQLSVGEFDMGPVKLKMQRNSGIWEGYTEGAIASGQISGPNDSKKTSALNLNLEYLKIPEQDSTLKKPSKQKLHWDPGSIVDLNVRAKRFIWKDVDYGKLELVTSQRFNGMKIDRLNIRGTGLDLNLSGYWTASESGNRTSISGELTIDNLGRFLTRLGKSNVVRDSSVSSSVQLKWQDPLYDLTFETLSGTAQVEFGAGSLLTVEPGIGRLFGLFNLEGLKNLMLFDFGKLFGKGLAFEGVKSAFLLTDGRARITRLAIDAVPAEIIVAGEIDLVAEQLDDIVTVVPKGVVAAGASMILTQELPRSAVDGLINRQYQVTGKWDNPEIVRLPGTGKPL